MTYGVYRKDLKHQVITGMPLHEAQRWCIGDRVICTERRIHYGCELTIQLRWRPRDWYFLWRARYCRYIQLGPIWISWCRLSYVWADKIVKEARSEKG